MTWQNVKQKGREKEKEEKKKRKRGHTVPKRLKLQSASVSPEVA
jgi:hypothetical protein